MLLLGAVCQCSARARCAKQAPALLDCCALHRTRQQQCEYWHLNGFGLRTISVVPLSRASSGKWSASNISTAAT